MIIWWPVVALAIIFALAGFTKYIYPKDVYTIKDIVYSISVDLIRAVGVLMVVVYVIYTRLLTNETRKMAEATIGLYASERGTLFTTLVELNYDFDRLPIEAQEVTVEIHEKEKKLTDIEMRNLKEGKGLPAIVLQIRNMSSRAIEVTKVQYQARHTGNSNWRDVTCNTNSIGLTDLWRHIEVPLIVAREGEVEVAVMSITYKENTGVIQRFLASDVLRVDRIRKPEII